MYISLLDQIVTHGQHRYLQGNLEMWFRDQFPVVTNPTVKSYVKYSAEQYVELEQVKGFGTVQPNLERLVPLKIFLGLVR